MIVPVGLALSTKLAQNSRHHTSALYDGLNFIANFLVVFSITSQHSTTSESHLEMAAQVDLTENRNFLLDRWS